MNKRNLIVMVKCEIGCTYNVAAELADLPEGPIVYSTSGDYDLFTMFRLDNNDDIGHYVCETVQKIEGVRDTNTIVCFNPFTKDLAWLIAGSPQGVKVQMQANKTFDAQDIRLFRTIRCTAMFNPGSMRWKCSFICQFWVFVGHESRPDRGMITTQIGCQPVIQVRHSDGAIKVLHNRRPHKDMPRSA